MIMIENYLIKTKSTKNLPKSQDLIYVDFYAPSLSLVIEIDGWSHNYKEKYDLQREEFLKSLGLTIFKIPDIEVKRNLSWVMGCLKDFIIATYG